MRFLFALSFVALAGLLWAWLAAARHIRRTQRRKRALRKTMRPVVPTSASDTISEPLTEASMEFEELDPLSEVAAAWRNPPPPARPAGSFFSASQEQNVQAAGRRAETANSYLRLPEHASFTASPTASPGAAGSSHADVPPHKHAAAATTRLHVHG